MLYKSAQHFLTDPNKCLTLFGMSGVGKTTLSGLLPSQRWFHYCVDYRIGAHYLRDEIEDMLKRVALSNPFFRGLLDQDAFCIKPKIRFDNLAALAAYVGLLDACDQDNLDLCEFKRRQSCHRKAEIRALLDTAYFLKRAREIYKTPHFLCDTGGSMIEVVDPCDPNDPVIKQLTEHSTLIYLEASEDLFAELIRRGVENPKPMYYLPDFLDQSLTRYCDLNALESKAQIKIQDFTAWTLNELLLNRAPRYKDLAQRYGYCINSKDFPKAQDEHSFIELVAKAIAQRG